MNIGYEEDELKPYVEPSHQVTDSSRIENLTRMGYGRAQIVDSLQAEKFDDIYATYLLLAEKKPEV